MYIPREVTYGAYLEYAGDSMPAAVVGSLQNIVSFFAPPVTTERSQISILPKPRNRGTWMQ